MQDRNNDIVADEVRLDERQAYANSVSGDRNIGSPPKESDRTQLEAQQPSSHTYLLWMDTLCVPKIREYRKKAITEMLDVDTHAKSVVVLESQIRRAPSVASIKEILGQGMLSG